MFELLPDKNDEIINDEEFHEQLDHLLGNIAKVLSDKDIDADYFATPWAQTRMDFAGR